ncbi:hypothetical protein [Paracoccus litorisediminis]|uniref:Uncharacterized protein n=1 Tax=Paracoccus litorisediminis TaxID=2006130 RepID=A0A844HUZ0_9RHOB|nr:hypothetical protein [Paracoccus litorisediminis]MTH62157.1 hypothetical protein [Paracoccus litorisediminis]
MTLQQIILTKTHDDEVYELYMQVGQTRIWMDTYEGEHDDAELEAKSLANHHGCDWIEEPELETIPAPRTVTITGPCAGRGKYKVKLTHCDANAEHYRAEYDPSEAWAGSVETIHRDRIIAENKPEPTPEPTPTEDAPSNDIIEWDATLTNKQRARLAAQLMMSLVGCEPGDQPDPETGRIFADHMGADYTQNLIRHAFWIHDNA